MTTTVPSKGGRPPLAPPTSTQGGVLTRTARLSKIIELLSTHEVRSQSELSDLLAADGLHVTQGTLSRDLVEVGAVRVRGSRGQLVYAVPGEYIAVATATDDLVRSNSATLEVTVVSAAVEHSPDAILITDAGGRIDRWRPDSTMCRAGQRRCRTIRSRSSFF